MRLIDADIFTEECCKKLNMKALYSPACIEALVVDEMPTVEAEPVRHGHWIITGGTNVFGGTEIVCSECHDRVMVQRVEDELYCRHCGAKMDEVKE